MDADLHRVIRSPQPLTEQHVQFFMWQLLRGLEHLHACAVVHRDLKPANLLVNANCDLKITDFGLARVIGGPAEKAPRDGLTSYVVTRWYRAPEVLVGAEYGRAVDVVGGVHPRRDVRARAAFPGRDAPEQLRLILRVAATLPGGSAERDHVPAAARVSLDRLAAEPAAPLDALYPRASADALQMLGALLAWDPPAAPPPPPRSPSPSSTVTTTRRRGRRRRGRSASPSPPPPTTSASSSSARSAGGRTRRGGGGGRRR